MTLSELCIRRPVMTTLITASTIPFDLNRNIDAAALDVQTALTIAQRRLPIEMTIPPSFRKVNPADFPVLFVVLRSATLPLSTVHEYGDITSGQTLSQIPGFAQVNIYGARIVARGHSRRGRARQLLDPGRNAERTEAGCRPSGLRADGQGSRLPSDRGGVAQRFAGQARRGRANLRQRG